MSDSGSEEQYTGGVSAVEENLVASQELEEESCWRGWWWWNWGFSLGFGWNMLESLGLLQQVLHPRFTATVLRMYLFLLPLDIAKEIGFFSLSVRMC